MSKPKSRKAASKTGRGKAKPGLSDSALKDLELMDGRTKQVKGGARKIRRGFRPRKRENW